MIVMSSTSRQATCRIATTAKLLVHTNRILSLEVRRLMEHAIIQQQLEGEPRCGDQRAASAGEGGFCSISLQRGCRDLSQPSRDRATIGKASESYRRKATRQPRYRSSESSCWVRSLPRLMYQLDIHSEIMDALHEARIGRVADYERAWGCAACADAASRAQNELWSYRIEADRLQPIRYGSSSDVRL